LESLNTKSSIKKVTKATSKAKIDFEYVSGIAALGAKSVARALELPLIVDEGWKKAESFVEKSMCEKKKEIVVRLILKDAKKSIEDVSDSDEEKSDKSKGKKVHLDLLQN